MNRPPIAKPDNLFLLLFRALRQRRVPLALRLATHTLLLLVLALAVHGGIMGLQFRHTMQQQADALGQSLITQTAASATELLVANDLLSLNVLLSNLVRNPLVAHAAIYSVDNRVLAEAGSQPPGLTESDRGTYGAPITFQEVIAGRLRISLDMQQFQQPMTVSLQNMGLLSLILLAVALILSLRLGHRLSLPLMQLRLWLRDPDFPAPGSERHDEIGDLARQLQARLAPEPPAPEVHEPEAADLGLEEARQPARAPEADAPVQRTQPLRAASSLSGAHDEAPASGLDDNETPAPREDVSGPAGVDAHEDEDRLQDPAGTDTPAPMAATPRLAGKTAVLAVQLGAQDQLRRLPRSQLVEFLQRYRDCLEQVKTLYRADLQTLKDGSSLLLFHSRGNEHNYLTHALCCGELLRGLSHALQVEVAESGISLQLQLGLTQGETLAGLSQGALLLSEPAQAALALAQHSRNLLLIEPGIGDDALIRQRARIRTAANPEGARCVERLLEPYPALLERQLANLQEAQQRA